MYNMATNNYEFWAAGLQVARSSHTATLMSDGQVLIAGGFVSGTPIASLEICNPKTKTCSAAGVHAMSTPRGGHTATLLSRGTRSGQVLLCGGQNAVPTASITGSCDLFDPKNPGIITPAGALKYPRMGHAATLLFSGRVFVTGGRAWDSAAKNGAAWLYQPSTEIYDPVTDSWDAGHDALLQGRINHTVTVLNNGIIMIAGGYNSSDTFHCATGVGTEECWTVADSLYWGYGIELQKMGSHGNLDGAEYFDQKGGRTVIGESTFGTAPYRVREHSAVLNTDGSWSMMGGYGNIVRTVFTAAPNLSLDTVFYLTKTGTQTSVIESTSIVKFPLDISLARAVSGRLVDADAFFSHTIDGKESVAEANAHLYLKHSTAPLDGYSVSYGSLASTLLLQNPVGTATFDKQDMQSDSAFDPFPSVVTSTLTLSPVFPTAQPEKFTGTITATVAVTVPDMYMGIKGVVTAKSGSITDPAARYAATIETGSSDNIAVYAPYSCNAQAQTCIFVSTISISITGLMSNLSKTTTIYSPFETAGGRITLTLSVAYTADEIHTGLRRPLFNYGRSDVVIREMIFSSSLGFSPKENAWKDLSDPVLSPTLSEPVFNHAAIMTPAADTFVLGGRNCETAPAADCLRTVKTFKPTNSETVFIPSPIFSDGSSNWPTGQKLNSKRAFHTSTLLVSGQILTCGGSDGVRNLASCELMDPKTRKWTVTGSMNYARAMHTATLLPNGNVLVTGGVGENSSSLNYSEIFYPATRRWVAAEPMKHVRQRHTATLLPDGNVLVTGGDNAASAELFISSSASWQNVGNLIWGRAQHTATLLKNGNVLITGGVGGAGGGLYQTEIYRSASRDFVAGPDLTVPRYGHTANLLRDGRVLVMGGSDNVFSGNTSEVYDGSTWGMYVVTQQNRTNHRSILMPNGKVIFTGGEMPGYVQPWAEVYDPDFNVWSPQGKTAQRVHHTSVLTQDNFIINIGGNDGDVYLDTTEDADLSSPDAAGLAAETTRQMIISTATSYFNHGEWSTLISTVGNFHGITEASGGGAGPQNSSFSNPRVYMNQIDNPSGFLIDLSTRIYSLYGGQNTDWLTTLSSITIITPSLPGEMPYGWYTMRVAANGVFSKGALVQVTIPRPLGTPTVPLGVVQGISSITWSWDRGSIPVNGADGYNIYASSNDVFVATTAFTDSATYIQTGLRPNTMASLMVNSYNTGGTGPLSRSATYYTLAAPPTGLNITGSSFETANLVWDNNGNVDDTSYELSMYTCPLGDTLANCLAVGFTDPPSISTPTPFVVNFTSTFTAVNQLSPNQGYLFRVRAINGAGVTTGFSNIVSTLTVGNVNNLTGTAISSSAISWSWDESTGADAYELYDISAGTYAPVFLASTTFNYFTQNGLLPNRIYAVTVNALKTTPLVKGPVAYSSEIYTLAVPPGINPINAFTGVSTGSLTTNWLTNGNSTWTVYQVQLSTSPAYLDAYTVTVTTNGNSVLFGGLFPNIRYYARVYALNGDDRASAPADLGTKYTRARAPANVRPSVISMSGVTLTWDQNGNSPETTYEVRYTTETFAISSTTYIPFSAGFTGDTFAFPGLLTATTYYFDVAASNGESYTTARIQAVPAAYTLPGPSGAPSGSIGGTSDPKKDVIISGVLPTGRNITMTVPAGSFPGTTAIAISSSAQNPCSYLVGGIPIEVAVFSAASAQPQVPVTLTLSYNYTESLAAIDANRQRMVLARYNPVSGQCLPLETTIDTGRRTITATLNHFSTFQLMLKTAATNLNNVLIYPNPFYGNRGQGFVTITNMPASASVRIYTLSGDKVWEGSAGTTGMLIWRAQNQAGELVASGVYLAVIDSSGGKKVFKLAVER